MNDSPQPGSSLGPTSGSPNPPQAYPDPAYAGSAQLGPSYSAAPIPQSPSPTQPLPQYWTQTYPHTGSAFPYLDRPPEPPRGPRPWLWATAGFALFVVIGLVIWLVFTVFANTNPSTQATSIPATPSTTTHTPRTPTIPSRTPSITSIPIPTLPFPTLPTSPGTNSGETEPVLYEVTGQGKAMNIFYIDTGGLIHTEFNVPLPWSAEVKLPKPARQSASVTVINSGRNITCRISVDGVQVAQQTGTLVTMCGPTG